MKEQKQTEDEVLRVMKCTQSSGRQIALLTTAKRVLCYQSQSNGHWEPIEPRYWGLVAAIHRLKLDLYDVSPESGSRFA